MKEGRKRLLIASGIVGFLLFLFVIQLFRHFKSSADIFQQDENAQKISNLAKANDLALLEEDEYAVSGSIKSRSFSAGILFQEEDLKQSGSFGARQTKTIFGSKNFTTLVPYRDKDFVIRNRFEDLLKPFPTKLDPLLEKELELKEWVPVIIRFNDQKPLVGLRKRALFLGEFFEKFKIGRADAITPSPTFSPHSLEGEVALYNSQKDELQRNLKKSYRFKRELYIIKGVGAEINKSALPYLLEANFVEKVHYDYKVRLLAEEIDEPMKEIGVDQMWQKSFNNELITGKGQIIAIVDTGVDYTHPDLGGCFKITPDCKVAGGYDIINGDDDPMDDNGHGTHVASIAAGKGVKNGVAPEAKIYAFKVLNSSGWGSISAIIAGIDRATDLNNDKDYSDHVSVGNLSLGTVGGFYDPDDPLSLAVDKSTQKGVVWVAAAGNEGLEGGTITPPGSSRLAITVAAACTSKQIEEKELYCHRGSVALFSSRGPIDSDKPDISAPGVQICAARYHWLLPGGERRLCIDKDHIALNGTSMATPFVAGAVALVREVNPELTPLEVKELLKKTARDLKAPKEAQGAGLLDLNKVFEGYSTKRKVNFEPNFWDLAVTSQSRKMLVRKEFIIQSKEKGVFNLESGEVQPGFQITTDKDSLNFDDKGSAKLLVSIKIDPEIARPGFHTFVIKVFSNGVLVGRLPIRVDLRFPIQLEENVNELNFGIYPPYLKGWLSEPQKITLNNYAQKTFKIDFALNENLAKEGVELAAPSSLVLEPFEKKEINFRLRAKENLVNGLFRGAIIFSVDNKPFLQLPIKFAKYYLLQLEGESDYLMTFKRDIEILNQKDLFLNLNQDNNFVYLDREGYYDVIVKYSPTASLSIEGKERLPIYYVIKENILVSQPITRINISRKEAKNLVKIIATDSRGQVLPGLHSKNTYLNYLPLKMVLHHSYNSGVQKEDVSYTYFSDFSNKYKYEEIYEPDEQSQPFYHIFYAAVNGLKEDKIFTNKPTDFKKLNFQRHNLSEGKSTPEIFICSIPYFHLFCTGKEVFPKDASLPAEVKQTVYSLLPRGWGITYQTDNKQSEYCQKNFGKACPSLNFSPLIDISAREIFSRFSFFPEKLMDLPPQVETIHAGLGPWFWSAKFTNQPEKIVLENFPLLLMQDFFRPHLGSISIEVKEVKIGQSIFSSDEGEHFRSLRLFSGPGQYSVFLSTLYPYLDRYYDLRVETTFDTSLKDPNPPTFRRLNFFSGNLKSAVYKVGSLNYLEFDMAPVGGRMKSVLVSVSADGKDFNNANLDLLRASPSPLSEVQTYKAVLPKLDAKEKVIVKITALDNSNNSLIYTFEMPVER